MIPGPDHAPVGQASRLPLCPGEAASETLALRGALPMTMTASSAVAVLEERFGPELRRFLTVLLRRSQGAGLDADDLLQSFFAKLLTRPEAVDEQQSLSEQHAINWLKKALRNHFI